MRPSRLIAAAGFALASVAGPAQASAQGSVKPTYGPEQAVVTALIADIEAGRVEQAVSRIDVIETITGRPKLVTSGDEFVSRMKGCKRISQRFMPFIEGSSVNYFEMTDWKCPDGPAQVLFANRPGSSLVTIGEYSDAARIEYDAAHPLRVAPPPPPRASGEENR